MCNFHDEMSGVSLSNKTQFKIIDLKSKKKLTIESRKKLFALLFSYVCIKIKGKNG